VFLCNKFIITRIQRSVKRNLCKRRKFFAAIAKSPFNSRSRI
jgi:hypothetical protein